MNDTRRNLRVYRYDPLCNEHQVLVWSNPEDLDRDIYQFDGTEVAKRWEPLRVEVCRETKKDRRAPPSDTPGFSPRVAVLSERAVSALHDVLASSGEFLPLSCPDGRYYGYNVTTVLDALDVANSEVKYYSSDPTSIMRVLRYAFFESVVAGIDAFKLHGFERTEIFFSDRVRQAIKEAGLTGFDLQLVWSNEEELPRRIPQTAAPATAAPRRADVTDRPLLPAERQELAETMRRGLRLLGIGAVPPAPDDLQRLLYDQINRARSQRRSRRGREQLAVEFGTLWGHAVCARLRWEWAVVSADGEAAWAVVTPDRSHMILPLLYMDGLLADPKGDQTSLLLYNMLKEGPLPPAEPQAYLELG